MTKYLEIKQANSSTLIDDSISRLCLKRHGTLWDLASKYSVHKYSYYGGGDPNVDRRCVIAVQFTIPKLEEEILVGFKFVVDNFGSCLNYSRKAQDEILVNVYSSPSGLYTGSDTDSIKALSESIIVYTFGKTVTEVNRFGLEIFNANGERIFNSSEKLLQIVGDYNYEYSFFGNNFNSMPLSYTVTENSNNVILIPNQFLSGWTRSPNPNRMPYPGLYGITFSGGKIYSRLIITAGSYGDDDWTGGQSWYASYLLADGTYLP